MPLELAALTADELLALSRETTLVMFSAGILEDHGPHLPLGTDVSLASSLAMQLAQKFEEQSPGWKVVLYPGVPLGVSGNTRNLAVEIRGYVLRDWLVDSCRSLSRQGFQHFACVTGTLTPRQITAIEEAAEILHRSSRRVFLPGSLPRIRFSAISSAWIERADWVQSPLWPDPKEHAGKLKTSLALVVAPAQVRDNWKSLSSCPRKSSRWERFLSRWRRRTSGYWGNPGDASSEWGAQTLKDWIDTAFVKLRLSTTSVRPDRVFSSGYAWFPPNRSTFYAWTLGILIILFFFVGVLISLDLPAELDPR